ncbi:MAG: hypothetical protein ACE5IO_09410, partial [Thermoplasmata archaeon]
MSTRKDEILVDRKNPKWWQVEANDGEIELTLGPGHVTPGNVKKLTNRFGLHNPRVHLGLASGRYKDIPREYALEGNSATVFRTCKTCGSENQVDLWELVKKLGKPRKTYFGERYRWSYHDRRGLLRDVTFHATVPKESFEPFYRFMEHMEADNELPKKAQAFLKEA